VPNCRTMSQFQVWLLAVRPPTLLAAVSPVIVGSALAIHDGVFLWNAALAALLGAVAIQIGANLANDVFDAEKGADNAERIGPPRVVAEGLISGGSVKRATALAFFIAALAGLYLYTIAGWLILAIGVASIVAALAYVGGPKPYGYRGMGEISVFVFFGLIATSGSRFVHDQVVDIKTVVAASAVGLLITALLVANNIRDIDTDRAAGKQTLAVKLGRETTAKLFKNLVWGAFLIIGAAASFYILPFRAGLVALAAPMAIRPIKLVAEETEGPPLIEALQRTARLQLAFAMLLSLGIIWATP
jgi:1,4-dihydroxy-2-naphthoate octaprenyltransferase